MAAPHRNRVTPTGEIVAVPLRGGWTGNRGNLHRGTEIVRPWASPHWLICTLEWRGLRREQWQPGRLTWLYFHDEAVAFAAGHRPCASCRREAYNAYRAAWGEGGGPVGEALRTHGGEGLRTGEDGSEDARALPLHGEIDATLHGERLVTGTRRRRTHPVSWTRLPDGAFVLRDGAPWLVRGAALIAWTPEGYGERRRRPRRGEGESLTPPATVRVLAAGYPVQIDPGVG